jgi:hypothetical protein
MGHSRTRPFQGFDQRLLPRFSRSPDRYARANSDTLALIGALICIGLTIYPLTIVYDITSMSSFEHAAKWLEELVSSVDDEVLVVRVHVFTIESTTI